MTFSVTGFISDISIGYKGSKSQHHFGNLAQPVQLELAVRYYPKSIEHVVQDVTISLFYLHAQQMVLKGALNVEDDVLVTLASLQAQVVIFQLSSKTYI